MTRHALARLDGAADAGFALTPTSLARRAGADPGTAAAYSRFKHGDGAVAARYGEALALTYLVSGRTQRRGPLVVTSSGYDVAPPAAAALVAPFVATLARHGHQARVVVVHRHVPSDGDYATWGAAQRRARLRPAHLTVPSDVRGAHVVALDDVRVTGAHEHAAHVALRAAGARHVDHLYVVRVPRGRPASVEAELNAASVSRVEDVLALAAVPGFVPNARVARRLLALAPAALDAALADAPSDLVAWLVRVAARDGLAGLPRYLPGAERVRALDASRPV
ncbi:phosphoribosyltransferase family protein [Luteimicrobium sp. DT211]|uniref:phosphoribosyltransferase family protein n=1 Tax=Luteimicrobium sp. DT211 TaxID=3393412 RepID=UPI003CF716D2